MREVGLSLVFLSLVLGAGGVATRPLADPATAPEAPTAAREAAAAAADPVVAQALEHPSVRPTCRTRPVPKPVLVDASKRVPPPGFVSLNTQGYNYRVPGDPPQIIPDSTGTRKPKALE